MSDKEEKPAAKFKVIGYRLIGKHETKEYRVVLELRNVQGSATVSDTKFITEHFSSEKAAMTYAVTESKKEHKLD